MRKKITTKREVLHRITQVELMRTKESILYDANYAYYNEWLKRNAVVASQISAGLGLMDKKYFRYSETASGELQFERDEKGDFVFNEGLDKEGYKKEYDELLSEEATLYL